MKKLKESSSSLLNKPGHQTIAAVSWNIEIEYVSDSDFELTISDCRNVVNLFFNVDTDENFDNAMFKVDTLTKQIREFKAALKKAKRIYNINQKGKNAS